MPKPRVLWVGDSPTVPTGFGRVTENILERLRKEWAVGVLGINYEGDPHRLPYPIFPAMLGGDVFGINRFGDLVNQTEPDVVFILHDTWNVARFCNIDVDVPIVGYMPVDSPNQPEVAMKALNKLAMAVFYTQFGVDEARRSGYEGPALVIPHGVDTELYHPIDKAEARHELGLDLPDDAFIIGNINRNQPRKRLDLTLMYFARWLEEYDISDNVYLLLHCAKNDIGWDLDQLARYLGLRKRLIFSNAAAVSSMQGVPEKAMPLIYNALDFQITTTLGEGWGLTTHEGMACGVPQLMPEWSALSEWPRGGVRYAPVTSFLAADSQVTTVGGIADAGAFIREMDVLYQNAKLREDVGEAGRVIATSPRFNWDNIAQQFDAVLSAQLLETEKREPVAAGAE